MARLRTIDPREASGKAKELLEAVQSKLKITPNMTKVMANSPAVLQAYIAFSGALEGGLLEAGLRERVALLAAQENSCEYCLSAHATLGKMAGLNEAEIAEGRRAQGGSGKETAALRFAQQLIEKKGIVDESQVRTIRAAGYNDGEIAEIIAHVALNVFTNYFNNTAGVEVDFPRLTLRKSA